MATVAILPVGSALKSQYSMTIHRCNITPRYGYKRDIKYERQSHKDYHLGSDSKSSLVTNYVAHKPKQASSVNPSIQRLQKSAINTLQLDSESHLRCDTPVSLVTVDNGSQPPHDEDQMCGAQDTHYMIDIYQDDEVFDWYEEYQRSEAMNSISIFPEPDPEDASQYCNFVVPEDSISPVLVPAPFGSGRKGKDKSHEEYSAAASTFGWGGSYNSYANGRNGRRDQSDEDEDPNKHSNNNSGSGGGSGGGQGGDGGGDGNDSGKTIVDADQTRNTRITEDASTTESIIAKPTLTYGTIRDPAPCSSKSCWTCCGCGDSGATGHIIYCDSCSHLRCNYCTTYSPLL